MQSDIIEYIMKLRDEEYSYSSISGKLAAISYSMIWTILSLTRRKYVDIWGTWKDNLPRSRGIQRHWWLCITFARTYTRIHKRWRSRNRWSWWICYWIPGENNMSRRWRRKRGKGLGGGLVIEMDRRHRTKANLFRYNFDIRIAIIPWCYKLVFWNPLLKYFKY